MYLDLTPAYCVQVSFGTDLRLAPRQIGAIRDTVLAMYPAASLPWYFRESYRLDGREYEIGASVAPSTRGTPLTPYNVYLRLVPINDASHYSAPPVRELFQLLKHKTKTDIYCTVNYAFPKGIGVPLFELPFQVSGEHPRDTKVAVHGYNVAVSSAEETYLGSISVNRLLSDAYYYTVSFFESGTLTADFPGLVFTRATDVLRRVHAY